MSNTNPPNNQSLIQEENFIQQSQQSNHQEQTTRRNTQQQNRIPMQEASDLTLQELEEMEQAVIRELESIRNRRNRIQQNQIVEMNNQPERETIEERRIEERPTRRNYSPRSEEQIERDKRCKRDCAKRGAKLFNGLMYELSLYNCKFYFKKISKRTPDGIQSYLPDWISLNDEFIDIDTLVLLCLDTLREYYSQNGKEFDENLAVHYQSFKTFMHMNFNTIHTRTNPVPREIRKRKHRRICILIKNSILSIEFSHFSGCRSCMGNVRIKEIKSLYNDTNLKKLIVQGEEFCEIIKSYFDRIRENQVITLFNGEFSFSNEPNQLNPYSKSFNDELESTEEQ